MISNVKQMFANRPAKLDEVIGGYKLSKLLAPARIDKNSGKVISYDEAYSSDGVKIKDFVMCNFFETLNDEEIYNEVMTICFGKDKTQEQIMEEYKKAYNKYLQDGDIDDDEEAEA